MAYIHYCRNIIRQSFDRVLHHPTLFAGQGVRYRKLEVILTTTIDKLGKAGETVKVAPGHFRNHLMPKLLAVPNIDKFAHLISEQHKIYQPKEVEEVKVVHKTEEDITKEYQTAAKRLDNAKLVLRRFVKVDNELREPVTKDEIVAEKDSTRQVWIKVDDWDNLTANKQEARTYSKDISSYCGRLLEETEDELAELIKKGSVQVGYVSKVLCQDLSRHCSQKRDSGSGLAGNEDDDDEINSEL